MSVAQQTPAELGQRRIEVVRRTERTAFPYQGQVGYGFRLWPGWTVRRLRSSGKLALPCRLWLGKVGLRLNGAYVATRAGVAGRCQRGGHGGRRTRENGVRANKGMKLTKPGELRSFAAYPRCSTDHDGA